jgi:restriction system protein
MAIPDFQTLMLPLLRLAADGQEHRFRDVIEQLAAEFGLTEVERAELLPSGTQPLFDNRVAWARTYLKQAGLLRTGPKIDSHCLQGVVPSRQRVVVSDAELGEVFG